ncbi:MAG: ParB/RepB/Spo0J family partition protein [bacterium]|nr:ParB/RepB/Spo0J family partition protein [bacterium]MDD3624325.1 ParB/RepB/Spo0J family partition protein [Proteiniphilum sp.]MDD3967205.1 ParB/RepB/Spo0J family partition protein [Proteiniphilum sp.]MDD4458467.1 ParB/RepB/Spo0J family partition protein [Proteiniphilum sp.]
MAKKNALGRGLDALITFNESETQGSSSISEVDLDKIIPNPDQPRRAFSEEGLQELAASIRTIGVIQPVTLRKLDEDRYQIIAGERRYRASQMAGLLSIPAYIKTADDDETMEMALIENIQREDLNSIEIALAYQTLIEALSLTQEQLSERVGKKRATVTNYLRLLKLPAEVQMGVKDKKIDMGHARALVTIDDPVAQLILYNKILEEDLSVRKVEMLVREQNDNGVSAQPAVAKKKNSGRSFSSHSQSVDFDSLAQHLSAYFRTDVQFTCNKKGKGRITIPFHSPEELERLIVMFDNMKK